LEGKFWNIHEWQPWAKNPRITHPKISEIINLREEIQSKFQFPIKTQKNFNLLCFSCFFWNNCAEGSLNCLKFMLFYCRTWELDFGFYGNFQSNWKVPL
jgi:hypothetical protein